jgi:uncharacterized protein (TIGR02453 family)
MSEILSFLDKLSKNNNRPWFETNKAEYLSAKNEMEQMVQETINKIVSFDPSLAGEEAKKCVFRIYRDVRFSKNKDPYKTNMGAFMVPGGKKSGNAGYYLHLEPTGSFIAGGIYMPESSILKKVREEIFYQIDEFKSIIEAADFKQTFGTISGEKLKNPPKGFPKEFEEIELLKYKSFTVMHSVTNEQVNAPDFIDYSVDIFKKMKDFNTFINRAIR